MSFATKLYWIFLAVVVAVLWALPSRLRKAWLLIASFVFYASWSVSYLALLVTTAALNHFGSLWIVKGNRARRGAWVIAGNLLLLGVFKYLSWMLVTVDSVTKLVGLPVAIPIPHWVLPLGISFYLFESLSYIIDVIRKREKPHSLVDFQLFIAFFPKLIAGPILRAKEFLPQVERALHLRASDAAMALRQIAIGMVLKLTVADTLGQMVDRMFSRPTGSLKSADVWLMGLAFGLQVYFDFSAYTRMAIGSAKLCGVDLVSNFNHPFLSTSPAEFWQRWHMSLSRWVRDYLFYPMAQSAGVIQGSEQRVKRVKKIRLLRAAFLSMVVFGIWHGAGWTFLLFGVYHGALLAGYHLLTDGGRSAAAGPPSAARARPWIALAGWLVTNVLFIIGFLLFRARTLTEAFALVGRALRPLTYPGRTVPDFIMFRTLLAFVIVLLVGYFSQRSKDARKGGAHAGAPPRERGALAAAAEGLGLGVLLVLALLFMDGGHPTFIYFQF